MLNRCPDERTLDAFLSGRLAGDALHTLDAHLAECESCGALVGVLAGDSSAPAAQARAATSGDRVGPYELRAPLGEGAAGVVWEAFEPQLQRSVALKLLRGGWLVEEQRSARLLREARAMARLAHPNVVAVYEAGEDRGQRYVAMELVRGGTLRAWLGRGPREPRATLEVLLQAGDGLAAAHEAELVHRDFKPENVLVGDDGRPRVTDFGLARAQHDRETKAK